MLYEEAAELVEKWSKRIVILFAKIIVPLLIVPTALHCYVTYFTTELGASAFELPYLMWQDLWNSQIQVLMALNYRSPFLNVCRFPFEWKNPIGYLLAIFLQIKMVELVLKDAAFFWSFALGIFLYTIAFVKDLKCNLKNMQKSAKIKKLRSHIMEQMTESLGHYTCLKR